MKQFQIINAYQTLETLAENEFLTELDQWAVYKVRKMLKHHIEFQNERETSIREKFMEYTDENGNLQGDKAKEYLEDIQKLNNLDVELEEFEKPKIKLVKGITCKIMEPLEDFIEFTSPAE